MVHNPDEQCQYGHWSPQLKAEAFNKLLKQIAYF